MKSIRRKAFLLILLVLLSCSNDFSKPKYAKRIQFSGHQWKRRRVSTIKTGSYRNPLTKKEARRQMLSPKRISFDAW